MAVVAEECGNSHDNADKAVESDHLSDEEVEDVCCKCWTGKVRVMNWMRRLLKSARRLAVVMQLWIFMQYAKEKKVEK